MTRLLVLLVLVSLAGCAVLTEQGLNKRYGKANPTRYDQREMGGRMSFRRDVMPILEQRCVVCHGCYDAPCQLKLTAWEGITRGGTNSRVYDGTRLLAVEPTRLFVDADKVSQWRNKGFHTVLNERADRETANLDASVFYQMLRLKTDNPLPEGQPLLPESFDLSLDRTQSCPRIEEFEGYQDSNPLGGMPFGLPGLSQHEYKTLEHWLAEGGRYEPAPVLPQALIRQVGEWERFLNADSLKSRLMSRYVYEHWFLAHLYFANDGQHHYFELVRSKTPPGQPIVIVNTRRPYDDPGVDRVYYRFRPVSETLLDKTHMPYQLDSARMAWLSELFLKPEYAVDRLPGYSPTVAANPFKAFESLPVKSRYRLMLEEAQFTILGFIKGPVCRGQVALNVIDDHFWVFFVNPESMGEGESARFLASQKDELRLPAEEESNAPAFITWSRYSDANKAYLNAKNEFLKVQWQGQETLPVSLIWNGDGPTYYRQNNDNAALTIFRHYDSATVLKGLVGEPPKTAWVINYSLLERIHYLLVAGFDVYGNVGHQLHTRLYMDFLRMEGEYNFLSLLPAPARRKERDFWYRDARASVFEYLHWQDDLSRLHLAYDFKPGGEKQQLYGVLKSYLSEALDGRYDPGVVSEQLVPGLVDLASLNGAAVSILPQVIVLSVESSQLPLEERYYTLINNSAHNNISHPLLEEYRRLPKEDTLSVVRGVVASYPNAFWKVSPEQLRELAAAVRRLRTEQDYAELMTRFGVRRTHPDFWQFSDRLHRDIHKLEPITGALLDYNRLENR